MSDDATRSRAACETCGSTDRVRPYGMDGTPLCWAHMLEANAKEDAYATPDRPANIISLGKWADIPEWTVRNCPSGFSVQRGEYGQGEEVVTTFVDLGHIKAIFENGLREWAPWVIADLRKILEEHDG